MTLEQHDAEVRASVSMNQAANLRARLLNELDELEQNLRSVREVAEALPTDGVTKPLDTTKRRRWPLWK